jgi:O-antigen ligase
LGRPGEFLESLQQHDLQSAPGRRFDLPGFSATAARLALAAAIFSLALPTAWASLTLALFLLFWLLSGEYRKKWQRVRDNPAALAAIALFLLHGIGVLYSPASWQEALEGWDKYHKLLYIPLAVSLLHDDPAWRRRAADAFFWSMLLVLAISYLKWLGLVPHEEAGSGYIVFKSRITHNVFMAFTVFLALERALRDRPRRWLWTGVALLAAANVLFLVTGRTGQVILPFLLMLFVGRTWGWRVLLGATTGGAVCVALALTVPSLREELGQQRILQIHQEVREHQPGGTVQTSSGLRMEFYRGALALIGERPVFGWGTGSFGSAYRDYAERIGLANRDAAHPHSEYLLVAQQLGLVGLAVLLLMGGLQWRAARRIDPADAGAMQALLLAIGIGSLFNSFLLDSAEGKFFCLLAGVYLSGMQSGWNAIKSSPSGNSTN